MSGSQIKKKYDVIVKSFTTINDQCKYKRDTCITIAFPVVFTSSSAIEEGRRVLIVIDSLCGNQWTSGSPRTMYDMIEVTTLHALSTISRTEK